MKLLADFEEGAVFIFRFYLEMESDLWKSLLELYIICGKQADVEIFREKRYLDIEEQMFSVSFTTTTTLSNSSLHVPCIEAYRGTIK